MGGLLEGLVIASIVIASIVIAGVYVGYHAWQESLQASQAEPHFADNIDSIMSDPAPLTHDISGQTGSNYGMMMHHKTLI